MNQPEHNPAGWLQSSEIQALRVRLLRFARLQLRDMDEAEDVVQDALLSAFRRQESFRGEAKIDTWVFSILRNRIIDSLRNRKSELNWTPPGEDEEPADEQIDALFRANAHWQRHARPHDWGEPEVVLDNREFWQVFDICMTAMKENIARVFTMREFLGLETAEICEQLAISENNCWTLLHRARSRLRLCLETHWLNAGRE